MTTITINERTKAGKTLLELANLLATNNKGVTINVGLGKPSVNDLTPKQRTLINRLKKNKKEVDNGTFKGKSAQNFLDEL